MARRKQQDIRQVGIQTSSLSPGQTPGRRIQVQPPQFEALSALAGLSSTVSKVIAKKNAEDREDEALNQNAAGAAAAHALVVAQNEALQNDNKAEWRRLTAEGGKESDNPYWQEGFQASVGSRVAAQAAADYERAYTNDKTLTTSLDPNGSPRADGKGPSDPYAVYAKISQQYDELMAGPNIHPDALREYQSQGVRHRDKLTRVAEQMIDDTKVEEKKKLTVDEYVRMFQEQIQGTGEINMQFVQAKDMLDTFSGYPHGRASLAQAAAIVLSSASEDGQHDRALAFVNEVQAMEIGGEQLGVNKQHFKMLQDFEDKFNRQKEVWDDDEFGRERRVTAKAMANAEETFGRRFLAKDLASDSVALDQVADQAIAEFQSQGLYPGNEVRIEKMIRALADEQKGHRDTNNYNLSDKFAEEIIRNGDATDLEARMLEELGSGLTIKAYQSLKQQLVAREEVSAWGHGTIMYDNMLKVIVNKNIPNADTFSAAAKEKFETHDRGERRWMDGEYRKRLRAASANNEDMDEAASRISFELQDELAARKTAFYKPWEDGKTSFLVGIKTAAAHYQPGDDLFAEAREEGYLSVTALADLQKQHLFDTDVERKFMSSNVVQSAVARTRAAISQGQVPHLVAARENAVEDGTDPLHDFRNAEGDRTEDKARAWLSENLPTMEPSLVPAAFKEYMNTVVDDVEELASGRTTEGAALDIESFSTDARSTVLQAQFDSQDTQLLHGSTTQSYATSWKNPTGFSEFDHKPVDQVSLEHGYIRVHYHGMKYSDERAAMIFGSGSQSRVDEAYFDEMSIMLRDAGTDTFHAPAPDSPEFDAWLDVTSQTQFNPSHIISGQFNLAVPSVRTRKGSLFFASDSIVTGFRRKTDQTDFAYNPEGHSVLIKFNPATKIKAFETPLWRSVAGVEAFRANRPDKAKALLKALDIPESEHELYWASQKTLAQKFQQ